MGRPQGPATTRKEFRLEARQIDQLEALIATAPLGKPSFVSLVRQAVDEFIAREFARSGVRAHAEKYLKERRAIVSLHEVGKKT